MNIIIGQRARPRHPGTPYHSPRQSLVYRFYLVNPLLGMDPRNRRSSLNNEKSKHLCQVKKHWPGSDFGSGVGCHGYFASGNRSASLSIRLSASERRWSLNLKIEMNHTEWIILYVSFKMTLVPLKNGNSLLLTWGHSFLDCPQWHYRGTLFDFYAPDGVESSTNRQSVSYRPWCRHLDKFRRLISIFSVT